MKKTLYSVLALAMGAVAFTSCEDQLDIEQKGVTSIENFYKTDGDAEAALAAAYEGFMCNVVGRQPDMGGPGIYTPYKILVNMCGDDVLYASGNYGDNIRLNNYLIMRYAEVLLNYAEACIQTGDAATAKTYINMIQERAGSQTISASVDMEVLKKEKSYELWLEGCRWFDVIRWKDQKAISRLEAVGSDVPHLFDKLFRAPAATDEKVTWEHGTEANSRFYTVSSHAAKDAGFTVGFKAGKHEYFPFPQTVMDKNPNLVQNPGWN